MDMWDIWGLGFPKIMGGYLFRGPYNKGYRIWGSAVASP